MKIIVLTLALLVEPERILLGLKKRGFGAGRWNGFGGKVTPGESIPQAARRELLEEAGITSSNLDKRGVLSFTFDGSDDLMQVHVFHLDQFEGEPSESDEMRPQWFSLESLSFDQMWDDDRHWFPLFLQGAKFEGQFHFSAAQKLLNFKLSPVSSLAFE